MTENDLEIIQWEMNHYDMLPVELKRFIQEYDANAHTVYTIWAMNDKSISKTLYQLQNNSFISTKNNI